MRTTQQKFLDKLEEYATGTGWDLELVTDFTYANIGSARFQKVGSFEAILKVGFDFQAGYCSLIIDDTTKHHYVEYKDGLRINRILGEIRSTVRSRCSEKQSLRKPDEEDKTDKE